MNPEPVISILTPVWNGLPYIKECIASVFSQDFQNWELIISDNGSTDGTRDYLDSLEGTDPRIIIFKQEMNLGIDGNLNFLFSKASTPLAYVLCADDYFYAGALGSVIHAWETAGDETAFIAFNWKVGNEEKSILVRYSNKILPNHLDSTQSQLAFFLFGNLPGNLSNVCSRVAMVRAAGGFRVGLKQAVDFEIWARLSKSHDMILAETTTAYIRKHEGEASFYLNKKGALFAEHLIIYEPLVEALVPFVKRDVLINYFNVLICASHLRGAIRAAFHGQLFNIQMFFNTRSTIFWPPWKQLAFGVPLAVFERLRLHLLSSMAKRIMKEYNAPFDTKSS